MMGTNYHVYLGPYLECQYTIVETVKHHWCCQNEKCLEYRRRISNDTICFCGSCGKPLGVASHVAERPSVDSWEIVNEIDEALSCVDLECIELPELVHIWIPNIFRDEPREFYIDPLTDLQVTPLDITPGDERIWLAKSFEEEIGMLLHRYERCDIMWGLIVYVN